MSACPTGRNACLRLFQQPALGRGTRLSTLARRRVSTPAQRIRLKRNIPLPFRLLNDLDGHQFAFPILEEIVRWDQGRIRAFFEAHGFVVQEWDKVRTDTLTISEAGPRISQASA